LVVFNYRLSESDEESKGIDGYIEEIPVSIKPHTYDVKASLPEHIDIKTIYYRKVDDGLEWIMKKYCNTEPPHRLTSIESDRVKRKK